MDGEKTVARWQKIALLIVVLAALAAAGRFVVFPRLTGGSGDAVAVEETTFVIIGRGTLKSTVTASGSIVYPEQVALGFPVSADLREILVAVGDQVAEGAPLASIDDTDLRVIVREREADLRTAELNYEKLAEPARAEDVRTKELAVADAEARLAELLDGPEQTAVNDAETAVLSAQVAYDRASASLQALLNPKESDVAAARNEVKNAEASLAAAQENLDALRAGGTNARIKSAENAMRIANNRLNEERERIKTKIDDLLEELEDAEERLVDAKEDNDQQDNAFTRRALEEAQEDYDEVKERVDEEVAELEQQLLPGPPSDTTAAELTGAAREARLAYENARVSAMDGEEAAQRSVESAARTLTAAKDRLDALLNPDAADVTLAEKEVESARLTLENAQDNRNEVLEGPKSDEVERARNDLELKRLDLQETRAGAASEDLELEGLKVERARRNLEAAQQDLADATLRAPYAGVVAEVQGNVGQKPGAVVVTLVRTDRVEMHARVDEADVTSVMKGQPVSVTLFAAADATFAGTVDTISPVSTTEQGVVLYPITIRLEPGDPRLRGGLSANATIEIASRNNILLVPNRAIRREGDERVIYVRQSGNILERRVVEIGVRDNEYSEIVSGVSEGEEVAILPRTGGTIGSGFDVRTR